MKANCIDVSTWNNSVDYKKVKAAGVNAVIIRAGYGRELSQKDNRFEQHYAGAKAAGLKIGAYWYSYASSVEDAELEARVCIATIKGKAFQIPIYFDMEEQSIANKGKTTVTAMALKFCDTMKAAGYRTGVYANPNWFTNYLDYEKVADKYSIWLAHWGVSAPSRKCDIWQFGVGHMDGVSGECDLDIIENTSINSGDKTTNKTTNSGKESIKAVQKWLDAYYNTGLVIDGIYGAKTKAALVTALQMELNKQFKANLYVDGIFGDKTKSKVRNIKSGDTGALVRILQGLLICNGYDTGGFDGVYGAKTEKAVKEYQRKKSLVEDGIAGKNTFAALCR